MPCLSFFLLFEGIIWGNWKSNPTLWTMGELGKKACIWTEPEWMTWNIYWMQTKTHKRREKKVAAPYKTFLLKVWHIFGDETILQTTRLLQIKGSSCFHSLNAFRWSPTFNRMQGKLVSNFFIRKIRTHNVWCSTEVWILKQKQVVFRCNKFCVKW